MMKKVLSFILAIFSLLILTACNEFATNKIVVTFDSAGGSLVEAAIIEKGTYVTKPANDPEFEDFIFKYWYLENSNEEFDFENTALYANTTLFAYWEPDESIVKYLVSFEVFGGSNVSSKYVKENAKLGRPVSPIKSGHVFLGWFVDEEYTLEYDFDTPVISTLVLYAKWEAEKVEMVTVSFNSNGGNEVLSQEIVKGSTASSPVEPLKDGYEFLGWYSDENLTKKYNFSSKVNQDLTLYAKWDSTLPYEEKLALEIAEIESNLRVSRNQLYLPSKGEFSSSINWWTGSNYISNDGVILDLPLGVEGHSAQVRATITIKGKAVNHFFDVEIYPFGQVELSELRYVPFYNMTTEYNVSDNPSVPLYYEENGNVPYISIYTFLSLVSGFIDPEVNLNYEYISSGVLEISYDYYSEEDDHTFHLVNTLNANDNTISVNDSGFYWAYVYSTTTNYGRHIMYPEDTGLESYVEGVDVVYELSKYAIDIIVVNDEIVIPLALANQIYAGSSYYNVYYNNDALIGIDSVPDEDSDAYLMMKDSSVKGDAIPGDLVSMTFNMLAFYMDYFYGLKDIMEVETYYDLLLTPSRKNTILSSSATTLDKAIFTFIYTDLAELHTNYQYSSYYNKTSGPSVSLSVIKGRYYDFYYDSLFPIQDKLKEVWTSIENRPEYWFLDSEKTSVVISLDGFSTKDIVEDNQFNEEVVSDIIKVENLLPSINSNEKYFYYNTSTLENNRLEIIVKNSTYNAVENYKNLLSASGFNRVGSTSNFTKEVNGKTYLVNAKFDHNYKVMYVGVVDENDTKLINDVKDLIDGDSAVKLEFILDAIFEENENVENAILDVSYNTGGNVGALYRVVGLMTPEPFVVTRLSEDTKSRSTSVVQIDGVSTRGHSLKWAVLSSGVSFSAANSLVTIVKENNIGLVIGQRSGGGAASITPVLLPNGTAFTMSSNSLNGYRTGSGTESDPYVYVHNEFGVDVDYELSIHDMYNAQILLDILNKQTTTYYLPSYIIDERARVN